MKRKVSLLLVLSLMLTLVPMSAFAASDNRVIAVPTVVDDRTFTASDAPTFRIEEKDTDFGADGTVKDFRLELTNAEWTDEMFYSDAPTNTVARKVYAGNSTDSYIVFEKRTDTSAKVTMTVGANRPAEGMYFEVPMISELQGSGDAKVTVDPVNSALSAATYTFAVGNAGDTIASVGDAETFTRKGSNVGSNILIDETVAGALKANKTQKFRLRLPRDMKWNAGTEVEFDSNFTGKTSNIKLNGTAGTALAAESTENDGRDLIVEFTLTSQTASRGTIKVKPVVNVTKDAEYGEVAISLNGLLGEVADESGLAIGNYKDYGVSVTVEEVKEFVSGRVDDDYITAKVTIEENVEDSLIEGRTIDFELPTWAKLVDGTQVSGIFTKSDNANVLAADGNVTATKDTNEFSIEVNQDAADDAKKIKYELELPLTVKGTETGDIELKVKGAGIESTNVVVAKAVAPVEVTVNVADVKTGIQKQAAPDIFIKENYAGAIMGTKLSGNSRSIQLAFEKTTYGMNFDDATYEVIEGDLEIDQDSSDVYDGYLDIVIKGESDKPSTIKVSGIKMTLDRSVPEGPFNLDIKGTALVDNGDYDDYTTRVARFEFSNVITKAQGDTAIESNFVIGNKTYKVGDEERTADVAPYITDGRTMLSLRYVSEAMGVSSENIMWNAETKTVTIFKGDRVAQVQIGSDKLFVNGVVVPMDTIAVIKEGRTMLPIRFVAQALGAQVEWDGATRTVTIK